MGSEFAREVEAVGRMEDDSEKATTPLGIAARAMKVLEELEQER